MAAGNRDRTGGRDGRGDARQQAEEEPVEHRLSALHPDSTIATYLAKRLIQRRAAGRAPTVAPAEAAERLRRAEGAGGAPLPQALEHKFSSSLGADLKDVRVHTGAESAAAAESVGARAYTTGKNVHFAAGQYDPASRAGQELLAHEVAHTVQQSGRAPSGQQHKLEVSGPADPAEAEADHAAAKMMSGSTAGVFQKPAGVSLKPNVDPAIQAKADAVAEELKTAIEGAVLKKIRDRLYPGASAENLKEAKLRKQGAKDHPDLTGLGKIQTVEHFAGAVKAMKPSWGKKSFTGRVTEVGAAIQAELKSVGVPPFLIIRPVPTEFKGYFTPSEWSYNISNDLVNKNQLKDADAAELCNNALHEARHAEQNFLAARYAAGPQKKSAEEIAAAVGIPIAIAKKAVEQRFDDKTDAAVFKLGEDMFKSEVTDGKQNQQIITDFQTTLSNMNTARGKARNRLQTLKNAPSASTIADAEASRDALNSFISSMEKLYLLYRKIPSEADAHAVGDTGELAYEGWPA
jgi:hypothetical protein